MLDIVLSLVASSSFSHKIIVVCWCEYSFVFISTHATAADADCFSICAQRTTKISTCLLRTCVFVYCYLPCLVPSFARMPVCVLVSLCVLSKKKEERKNKRNKSTATHSANSGHDIEEKWKTDSEWGACLRDPVFMVYQWMRGIHIPMRTIKKW